MAFEKPERLWDPGAAAGLRIGYGGRCVPTGQQEQLYVIALLRRDGGCLCPSTTFVGRFRHCTPGSKRALVFGFDRGDLWITRSSVDECRAKPALTRKRSRYHWIDSTLVHMPG